MTASPSQVGLDLLAYGLELEREGAAQVGGSFTGDPDADALLTREPNAFLIGVLFTQGVPAERAWMGPWSLRQRLGTLDLAYLAANPDQVRDAVQAPPMLHRFKETLPRWISAAAVRIMECYSGDAGAIWADGSTVLDVIARLSEFDGIGRKKAVMATEILSRHMGVGLVGRQEGQVAYDVQVRRVFLRAGLVDEDSVEAIERVAREISPDAPGRLDLAAWLVGRQTCRPRTPMCDRCRLGVSCPRRVWISVRGVG